MQIHSINDIYTLVSQFGICRIINILIWILHIGVFIILFFYYAWNFGHLLPLHGIEHILGAKSFPKNKDDVVDKKKMRFFIIALVLVWILMIVRAYLSNDYYAFCERYIQM
jgi:hypothetical protein